MNRSSLRIVTVLISLAGLSGCAAVQDSTIFQPQFWTVDGGRKENTEAELGLAELAKGNNVMAQAHFEKALQANPQDVHALYGLGVLYQNTGQPTRARQQYEQILALNPRPLDQLLVWADKQTQPIVDLAAVNIHLLENGATVMTPGAPRAGEMVVPGMSGAMPIAPIPSTSLQAQASFGNAGPGRGGAGGFGQVPLSQAAPGEVEALFKDADLNIVARFEIMRALLDQGLLTQDEFTVRRNTNVGALLPMTTPPAAVGLDRPVPSLEQISGRLRAIGRALEMRALTPAQHTSERAMILDALMPAQALAVANPAPPPKGLMESADAVRRLEMLKNANLITENEYAQERAAIETSMQQPALATKPMMKEAPKSAAKQDKPALSGFQPAVHLSSYRQKKAAERGWVELSKRFGSALGELQHRIERVDLGTGKGVFYRLKAGPLLSNKAAKDLCRALKAKRQYCEPTTINFG